MSVISELFFSKQKAGWGSDVKSPRVDKVVKLGFVGLDKGRGSSGIKKSKPTDFDGH